MRTDSPQSVMRPADKAICGGALTNRGHKNVLAHELVSDSRVLIEHARLLMRNSNTRIDHIERRLEDFVAAMDDGGATHDARRRRLAALIARWLDRREAA